MPSWRAGRSREVLPENREGLGRSGGLPRGPVGVGRPIWRAERGQ